MVTRLDGWPHSCRRETPVTIIKSSSLVSSQNYQEARTDVSSADPLGHSPDATLLSSVISQRRSKQVQATRFAVIPDLRIVVQAQLAHRIIAILGIRRVAG